ncbi:MAG: hypothetical protein ACK5HT_04135 [Draconibacterium sp.]
MECYRFSWKLFSWVIFILVPLNMLAQNQLDQSSSDVEKLFKVVENYYPLNDEYTNGFVYNVRNSRIAGDPYFNSPDWLDGTLYINGTKYCHISVKYNLIIEELIVKTKTAQDIERVIVLNKSQLDSFHIGTSLFIHSGNLFAQEQESQFYEVVCGRHQLLKVVKHYEKRFIDTYSSSSPYGKYSTQKSDVYLFDGVKLTSINSEKSFLTFFEKGVREQIREYFRGNSIKYKNMSVEQLNDLIDYCVEVISQ